MYRFRTCIFTLSSAAWLACSAGQGPDDDNTNTVPAFGGNSGPATPVVSNNPGSNQNPASSSTGGVTPGSNTTGTQTGASPSGSQNNEMQPGNAPIAAGTPNSGAGMASGGSAASSSMTGAMAGMNAAGAGGAGNAPAAGAAGATQMPPPQQGMMAPPAMVPPATPPPTAPGNCGSQFLCDDFEGGATGASPNAAIWTIIDSYTPQASSAAVQISTQLAHGGSQSVHIAGSGGRYGIRATLPQNSYFMRAFFDVDAVSVGPVFIGLGTDQDSEVRFRIQGRSFATINVIPGDGVSPGQANSGNCPDCVTLTPNRWFCAEMSIDNASRSAVLWIDGVEAARVTNGDFGWANQPDMPQMFIGSWGLQGGMAGVYVDDVAAGPTRIGCN